MEAPAPQKLEYAPSPPKGRKIARRVVIGFALTCVAVVLLKLIPAAWVRVQLLYWQNKCMNYSAPPDQQVVDWNKLSRNGRSGVIPIPWQSFYGLLSPPGARSSGTLFLHERTSSNGHRRLVAIDLIPSFVTMGRSPLSLLPCDLRLIEPGSVLKLPQQVLGARFIKDVFLDINTTYYVGQPDPQDSAHFTIRAVTKTADGNASENIIDGWLQNDDTVSLELRAPGK